MAGESVPAAAIVDVDVREATGPEDDFEIVLGRRQIASVLFLATVILAVFSAVSYVAGKAMSPRKPAAMEHIAAPPVAAPAPAPMPLIQATIANPPASEPASQPPLFPEPLFADPEKGALYIQLGAIEKGVAILFAEGLRIHGLQAFVAPGPNDHIFRVLIGPLADHEAYVHAKNGVDDLGLSAFARRYEQ